MSGGYYMSGKKVVCIFCGAKGGLDPEVSRAARQLISTMAGQEITIVCGGGDSGLMQVITDAANEYSCDVVGVFPKVLEGIARTHSNLTQLIITPCLDSRKTLEWEMSDVFVALPGGYGTLDEIATVLLMATKLSLGCKPMIIFNHNGFWDGLIMQIDRMVHDGFLGETSRDVLQVVCDSSSFSRALVDFLSVQES